MHLQKMPGCTNAAWTRPAAARHREPDIDYALLGARRACGPRPDHRSGAIAPALQRAVAVVKRASPR